jgi:hypothetical protein
VLDQTEISSYGVMVAVPPMCHILCGMFPPQPQLRPARALPLCVPGVMGYTQGDATARSYATSNQPDRGSQTPVRAFGVIDLS